jgi:type I restriction enzyme, S subunit
MSRDVTKPLSEIRDPSRSITYGIVQPGKLHRGGVPLVRVNNFKGHRLDLSEVLYVKPEVEAAYRRSRPRPDDILITLVGSIGQVSIAPKDVAGWNLARAVGLVPMPDRHHAEWVFYALQTADAQNFIRRNANTTVQATFNLKDLSQLPIPYPGVVERRKVVEVLSSLDGKIELNRRMNETLEAMAQTIFRDWFVDFGPTRRKMEGATDPIVIIGGVVGDPEWTGELAKLFPAMLGENGLPEGWEEGNLSRYSSLNPESWNARQAPERVEYVDLANTKWGVIESTTKFSWSAAPSRARRVVRAGDTIVGTVRPGNGSYAYIGVDGLTASTGFAVLRPSSRDHAPLVYCAATSRDNIERLDKLADGGAYPAVRPDVVLATQVPSVPASVSGAFSSLTAPLLNLIEERKRENKTLAATRDFLLPKLMSGEIRLSDAEVATEAAE